MPLPAPVTTATFLAPVIVGPPRLARRRSAAPGPPAHPWARPAAALGHPRDEGVPAPLVRGLALARVAVDEGTEVERAPEAPYLVLDREEPASRVGIDDVLEAVLVPVALLGDEPPLRQPPVRTREVRDVHLDVVPVVGRDGGCRL